MGNNWCASWLQAALFVSLCVLAAVRGFPTVRTEDGSAKADTLKLGIDDNEAVPAMPLFVRPHTFVATVSEPAGSTVRLRCPASGQPMPTIVWSMDGSTQRLAVIRPGGPVKIRSRSFALVLEDVRPSDAGLYTCTVCNPHGCIERNQTLIVTDNADDLRSLDHAEPEILSQNGVDRTSDPAADADIHATDDDNHDQDDDDDNDDEDDDYYHDDDNEDALGTDQPAHSTVSDVAAQITDKHDQSNILPLVAGNTIRVRCLVSGHPEPNVTWTRDNSAVPIVRALHKTSKHHHHGDLRLSNLQASDAGNYTCTACNRLGCDRMTVQLRMRSADDIPEADPDADADYGDRTGVHGNEHGSAVAASDHRPQATTPLAPGPPQFVKFDTFNRLLAKPSGNMVRIKCPAVGSPTPTIRWTKGDGNPIVRKMGDVKYRQFAIVLEDLIPTDSGNYTCTACNEHGCISYTMKLEVNDRFPAKPILKEGYPKNVTALANSTVTFECPVLTDLAVWVQWAKYHAYNETDNKIIRNEVAFETDPERPEVYTISNVTYADEGWYTCVATNSLGNTLGSAYLRVVDKLPVDPVPTKIDADPLIRFVGVTVFASFLLLVAIITIVQVRKIKHDKLMKHRNMERVHQWTKKIIIVRPNDLNGLSGDGATGDPDADTVDGSGAANLIAMQIPIVKIEKQRTTLVQQTAAGAGVEFNEYEFPLDSNWEWSRNQLTLGQTLGEGAFGRVVMAEAHGMEKGAGSVVVAVKMVKEGHTDTDMASLVREMEVMKMIGKHINIINLLGCCSQDGPLYVIVEYAPHGNLKDFLKKHRPLSEFEVGIHHGPTATAMRKEVLQKDLISIAFQVARGMEYLASRRCIHRDLAARNVLVSDDYVVKIADFGLARDIQESEYYRKNTNGRLPIKWMAPESLRDKFYDSQSDVWSFGVLLWETMTYGEQPYPQVFSSEHLYEFLREGNRMEKPSRCSLNIYMLMRQCWNWNSHERPTFTEIVENLDQILGANLNDEYLDVGLPRLETPPSSDDEDDESGCDDDNADSDTETLHEQSLLRYQHHR